MTPPALASFFSQIDFADPENVFLAFHHFRTWPKVRPIDAEAGMREIAVVQSYHPHIFGGPDGPNTLDLIDCFLLDLGGRTTDDKPGEVPNAPREWLCVFREAFHRGCIGPIAFGAAIAFLMVRTDGNGTPGLPPQSIEARRLMLADARRASPLGLMDGCERAALAALPETVTLWRGGSLAPGETLAHRANGLHWALDREYALTYMRGRNGAQTLRAIGELGRFSVGLQGMRFGRPFLLTTEAPREAILAYKAAGITRDLVEVLVDFDRLSAGEVHDVTPEAYRYAA